MHRVLVGPTNMVGFLSPGLKLGTMDSDGGAVTIPPSDTRVPTHRRN